ncbi:excalibur calcium-binding domain-containing protein [Rhizobium sp. TRM95796]|uniref:excalibur calcium-binding domain-containing protein n=1 Tax=Rhizobium sp. TRM95796 TaxID=2979862 RepID=UPI0021E97B7B|nr:excalibur calcium-binding domain-containing protein [Rhizobium sp. TRM95796]MCV3767273.1 excalibur calcium-binding domain-containing protein [Rhizobium sp. TRM95796]
MPLFFLLSLIPQPLATTPHNPQSFVHTVRLSCKQISSCEDAVALWCSGYRRADGDNDGVPCENVCHSLQQVEEIISRQGC